MLETMAHTFRLESLEDYREFEKLGKQFSTERIQLTCRKTYLQR